MDIAPELLKRVQESFQKDFNKSKVITELYAKVRDGTATYKEANEFALEVGDILANAYKDNLSADVLPDGKMYYNIAQRIIDPTMTNNYTLITDVTNQVQQSLNEAANIGIKPITPELNQDRIDGIVNRVSDANYFDDIAWILEEPIINFSQSIVDDAIRENAEFQSDAGLQPLIIRKIAGNCCAWCRALAGKYRYPDEVPRDVYRRHNYCRCSVDYRPKDGKIQNVHNNNVGNKSRYVKDKYGNYVLSKDAKVQRAKEMAATEEARKTAARNKRIATWEKKNEQQYLPVKGGQTLKMSDRKMGDMQLFKIDGYDEVYVQSGVKIKPKALHNINQNVLSAINAYGGNMELKPKVIVVDKSKLGSALGKYDCVQNVIYVVPDIGDKKLLSAFTTLDANVKFGSTEYHECWHWMQAQRYGKTITDETRDTEYMPWLLQKSQKNIESLGISEYNVFEISDYAEDAFLRGRFDEVEAEYYVKRLLNGKR